MKIQYILIFVTPLLMFFGCVNAPEYSDTPEITYTGISKSTLNQGISNDDFFYLFFQFTDGDGDIGREATDVTRDIILIDNRTGEIYDRFRAPFIPEQGASNGISGDVKLKVFNTCCIFPGSIPPCETPDQYPTNDLSFTIYMMDRAGNKSNEIVSETITLLCN